MGSLSVVHAARETRSGVVSQAHSKSARDHRITDALQIEGPAAAGADQAAVAVAASFLTTSRFSLRARSDS